VAKVLNSLERDDILSDQPRAVFAGPASGLDFIASKKRLGEPAETEKLVEAISIVDSLFGDGERVKMKKVVSALKRVTAESIEVKSSAPGNQNLLTGGTAVEQSLQIISPTSVLVQLVENPKFPRGKLIFENPLTVFRHIPVEIASGRAGKRERNRRLANLPRPGNEDHLPLQVGSNLRSEISLFRSH